MDGGEGLQMWREAVNIQNKWLEIAKRGDPPA
jgi:hypothetical protein